MKTYEYRIIPKPTEETLNRAGAEGFHVVEAMRDPRDGELVAMIMERETDRFAVDDSEAEPRDVSMTVRNGRRR